MVRIYLRQNDLLSPLPGNRLFCCPSGASAANWQANSHHAERASLFPRSVRQQATIAAAAVIIRQRHQRHATRRFELPIAQGAATNRNEAFLCSGSDAQIEKSAWKNKNDDHRSALWAVRVSDGAAATAEDNGRLDDGNAPRPQRARKTYTAPPSVRMTCQPASAELEPRQISMESGTMAHRTAQGSLRDHFGPVLRSCRQRNREKRNYFGTSVQSPARLLGLVLARFFMRFPNAAQAHRGDATNFAQPEWRSVWLACLAFPESLFTVGELAAVCAFWCS